MTRPIDGVLRLPLAAVLAAVLGGTSLLQASEPAPDATGTSRSTPVREAEAAAPAARSWRLGTLDLHACELPAPRSGASTAAWCNAFEVPENRADPDGRRIRLKLAVIRSDAGDAAKKTITSVTFILR
jgi:hypothetical protein